MFVEHCVQRTWYMVVIMVIQVVGAVLQGPFGGLEQCGLAQSVQGIFWRCEEEL